jgi:hypothetical protein
LAPRMTAEQMANSNIELGKIARASWGPSWTTSPAWCGNQ